MLKDVKKIFGKIKQINEGGELLPNKREELL